MRCAKSAKFRKTSAILSKISEIFLGERSDKLGALFFGKNMSSKKLMTTFSAPYGLFLLALANSFSFHQIFKKKNKYFWKHNFHSSTFSERGIFVIGFSYPVVPKGKARIRVQISAAHTTEDIDRTVEAFIEVGRARNVIPWLIKKSENTKISNHLNVELKYNVAQLKQVLVYFAIIELNDNYLVL